MRLAVVIFKITINIYQALPLQLRLYQQALQIYQQKHHFVLRLSKLEHQWKVKLLFAHNSTVGFATFDMFDDISLSDNDFKELSSSTNTTGN